ncbi:hypothetical protein INT43_005733 [Umbelopsis isabellina]|uniref:Cytochrome P450 n=1 Tax=Mortierella isabellina TaxID=91625 RepID=A0A8H7PM46_MORIS|nr:hypothetical protein INT43_005733 [Umbelopsis isabellina]
MNHFEQLRKWIPIPDKLIKTANDNSEIVATVAAAITLAGAVHIYYKSSKAQLQGNSIDGIPGPKHLPLLGDDWRNSRAWFFPQFSPSKINKTRPLIAKHAVQLRKDLNEYSDYMENLHKKWFHSARQNPNSRYTRSNLYNPKELKSTEDLFGKYAFQIIVDFSFANDNKDFLPENMFEDMLVLFAVLRRRILGIIPWYTLGIKDNLDRKCEATVKSIKVAIRQIIENYDPQTYLDNSNKMSTMLESLWYSLNHKEPEQVKVHGMASATKAANKLSLDTMVGNLLTVINAGYDTTANTLQSIAYMLAKHPHVQEKLHAEVDSVLGGPEDRMNMNEDEIMNKMPNNMFAQFPYATAIVNEAQRVHPVAPFLGMEAIHDTILEGYVIPKGTNIMLMTKVASMNHCPTADPFLFKPERWIESTEEQKRQQDRLDWSFGGGSRVCPGRHMANLELVSVVVLVFSLFHLKEMDRATNAPPVVEGATFTTLLQNVYIRYIPRV